MSRKILGLDIRENALAAVLINGSLQGNHIEAFDYIVLPEPEGDKAREEDGRNEEMAGERLGSMLSILSERMDVSGAVCIASVPSSQVSFRNLTLPFDNEKKINQIIHFELEPVMPGTVDDLQVAFKVIEKRAKEGETELVASSVGKGFLDSFEYRLKENGFEPQAVNPGCCAAAWYLSSICDQYEDYLYADMDDEICTLFLVEKRQPVYIRSFRINSIDIKGVSLQFVRTVLSFCENNEADYKPEVLFAAGSFFKDETNAGKFSEEIGLPVSLTDFYENSGFHMENRLKNDWHPALYDSAFAMAYNVMFGLSGLRFRERFFAIGKYVEEHRRSLINTGILLILVIVASLGNSLFESWTVNNKIRSAREEMAALYKETFPEAKVINDPYAQMKGKLKEARKNMAFQEKNSENIRVIDILNTISLNIPEKMNVEIDRFVLGTGALKLSGKADTYSTVDSMKKNLEKTEFFKKVIISSTTNDKAANTVKFKMKIEL